MKKIILFFATFFICYNGFAQNDKGKDSYLQIRLALVRHLESNMLKDSIALYTFAFQIEVKKIKDSTLITSITVNDSIANIIYPNYDFLRKINYAPFISKAKQATLVIPVALVITNYNSPTKTVDTTIPIIDLADRISKMFNYNQKEDSDTEHFIYLRPCVIYHDKAVYD
jgi:hypothetical protein